MTDIQTSVITVWGLISALVFIRGFYESKHRNNSYGLTHYLFWMGIIVWGDAVIFGLFWLVSSIISLLLRDWILFLLIISVFWIVRSLGETIYWLNQQFSPINRNPPEKLINYRYFGNDSIWFVNQIFWQCITVISIITTIYIAHLWLQ